MTDRPTCFESDEQWEQWKKLANFTKLEKTKFCIDCLPQFRDEMIILGRCARPETVFVISYSGDVTGLNGDAKGWSAAATGAYKGSGKRVTRPVVGVASPEAIQAEINRRKSA